MAYNFFFKNLGSLPSSSASSSKALVERDLLSLLEEKSYGASGLDVSLSLCPPNNVKKCTTCGEINTPLWRNGPDGPKTLCNACGIRYRKYEKKLNTDLTLGPHTPKVQGNNRHN